MTYSEKLYFTFNGINSFTYNLLNVHMQSGFNEEQFLPTRNLKETKIRGRSRPYLTEIEEQPRIINVEFGFSEPWDDATLREIVNWFNVDYYKELIFHFNPTPTGDELRYFAMPVDSSSILHAGLKTGYIRMQFRCVDQYAYSPVYLSTTERQYNYFLSPCQPAETYKEIIFTNNSDIEIKPIVIITMHGSRARIVNTTNSGQKIEFRNLRGGGEIIILDAQNEIIESSLGKTTYRYNQLTSDSNIEFSFVPGNNYLRLYGDFEVQFKFEEAYLTS